MTLRAILLGAVLSSLLSGAGSRDLNGIVVDAQTGQPVARARVTLHYFQGPEHGPELTMATDTEGAFRVTNLPDGGYQVSIERPGYLPLVQGMTGIPIPAEGQTAPPVKFRLTAQAAMEGTIVDDQDVPIPNGTVLLLRQQVVNGRRQLQNTSSGSADENGYFRIFGLPAGRYYLAIVARLTGPRAKSMAYPLLFYPKSTELAGAQAFDLKAGDEQRIQIRMPEPLPAYDVRGTIATTASHVRLMLSREGQDTPPVPNEAPDHWDPKTSTFRISGVTPGLYRLTATLLDSKENQTAITTVRVEDRDVRDVRLEPSAMALEGTVRVEGATAKGRLGFISLQSPRYSGVGMEDAEGKFHVANLPPDTYRVTPQSSNPYCVRSILQGGPDVRDDLVVNASGANAPIEVVLTTHCGTIDIALSLPDSPLPANLAASLLRKAGNELVLEKQAYLGPRPAGVAPHVSMQGVAPGEYIMYAWPQDSQLEYADPEYMKQYESYGKPVTVTEDGKVTVTLDKVLVPPKN